MNDANSRPNVGLIATAIVLGVMATYVTGYFALGTAGSATIGPRVIRYRMYDYKWQAELFWPLTRVESAIEGEAIEPAFRH